MTISTFAELELLDAVFNNSSYAVANVYVKLHIGDPGEAGTGNPAAHTTRVEATFGAAAAGAVSNDADITFASLAADETISHLSLWDHISAGNHLWYGPLTDPQAVNAGGSLVIAPGDLDVTLE